MVNSRGGIHNLKNFKKGDDPRRNYKGRPRKIYSSLEAMGYKKSEIFDTISNLLSMTFDELKEVFDNADATILERTIANALYKSIKLGNLGNIETLLTRIFGYPKQELEHRGEVKAGMTEEEFELRWQKAKKIIESIDKGPDKKTDETDKADKKGTSSKKKKAQ